MDFLRKHSIKHLVLKTVSSDKTVEFPDEYLWRKTRFRMMYKHSKDTEKTAQKFYKSSHQMAEDEMNFAKVFKKYAGVAYHDHSVDKGNVNDVESDKYLKRLIMHNQSMDDDEKKRMKNRHNFLQEFHNTFEKVTDERSEMLKRFKEVIGDRSNDIIAEGKEGERAIRDYENQMLEFSVCKKKLSQLEKSLVKKEEKSKKKMKMKDKEKSQKEEEDIIRKIEEKREELERLKKETAFCEKKTLDELQFQNERAHNDYFNSLAQIMQDYKQYFANGLKIMQDLEKKLNISQEKCDNFKSTERKIKTIVRVSDVREIFKKSTKTKIFSVDIEEVMQRKHETLMIPYYVDMMIEYLDQEKKSEGLFRKVGSKEDMTYLQRHIDEAKLDNFDEISDINTLASTFKQYIRLLPTSLCEFDDWIGLAKLEEDEMTTKIKQKFKKMNNAKGVLLYKLVHLLRRIADNSQFNKMDALNLSLIFSMNVIRPYDDDPIKLIDITPKINCIMKNMIENCREIFDEEPKPIYKKVKVEHEFENDFPEDIPNESNTSYKTPGSPSTPSTPVLANDKPKVASKPPKIPNKSKIPKSSPKTKKPPLPKSNKKPLPPKSKKNRPNSATIEKKIAPPKRNPRLSVRGMMPAPSVPKTKKPPGKIVPSKNKIPVRKKKAPKRV